MTCISPHSGDCCDCCPTGEKLRSEVTRLKAQALLDMKEIQGVIEDRNHWRTLALKAKEALERIKNVEDDGYECGSGAVQRATAEVCLALFPSDGKDCDCVGFTEFKP